MNRLAVTRAFGDFEFKTVMGDNNVIIRKNYITSEPEVRQIDLDPFIDDFVVLASDGLYDKFTS